MKPKRFTLIELIAVILIIGIVGVAASALFDSSIVSRSELNTATELLRADIRFVQNKALLNDDSSKIYSLSTSVTGYQMLINGAPPVSEFFPNKQDGQRIFDNVTISSAAAVLTFDNKGQPNQSYTFTTTAGSESLNLSLQSNGSLISP